MTNRNSSTPNRGAFGDAAERRSEVYQNCLAYDQREVPWHMEGIGFAGGETLMDVGRRANLFMRIVQAQPVNGFAIIDKEGKPTEEIITGDTIENASLGRSLSILRAPHLGDEQWRVLGTSSDRYSIIQNETLCQLLTPLEQYGKLDTAGVLRQGALFFASFHGTKWSVKILGKDEEHETFLVVKNSHLPGAALQFQIVNVRTVCMNTWRIGDNDNALNFSLPHTGNMEMIVKWVVEALEKIPQRQTVAKEALQQLSQMEGSERELRHYLLDVIPDPAKPEGMFAEANSLTMVPELAAVQSHINAVTTAKDSSYRTQLERRTNLRNLTVQTYKTSETVHRNTRLGYVESLTEALGHGVRNNSAGRQLKSTKESVLFGERKEWIEKGFELALQPVDFANQN